MEDIDFNNKKVLEIGTGNGGTTLEILEIIQNIPSCELITTDIIQVEFNRIISQYPSVKDRVMFIQADFIDIENKLPFKPDVVILHYTLCAINAKSGRFIEVLDKIKNIAAPNAFILIEEEYPIDKVNSKSPQLQQLWAEQWRILKALILLSNKNPYQEIYPEFLLQYMKKLDYKNVEISNGFNSLHKSETIPLLTHRVKNLISNKKKSKIFNNIQKKYKILLKKIRKYENIEIPIYQITANL